MSKRKSATVATGKGKSGCASVNGYEAKLRKFYNDALALNDEAMILRNAAKRRAEWETAIRYVQHHNSLQAFIAAFLAS